MTIHSKHTRFTSLGLLGLTVCNLSCNHDLLAATSTGRVENIFCKPDYYDLSRDKSQTTDKIGIYSELHAGDQIRLNDKAVALQFRDDQQIQITVYHKELPFSIQTITKWEELGCPDGGVYKLRRKGQILPLPKEGNPQLQSGDEIIFDPQATVLSIKLGGQPLKEVKYSDLPYTVPASGEIATKEGHLWEWVKGILTGQRVNEMEMTKVLITQGKGTPPASPVKPPYLALLERSQQQLVEGDRTLHLLWKGGTPPFTLTLEDPQGKKQSFPTGESQFSLPKLSKGKYGLSLVDKTLVDKTHATTPSYQFTVVEADKLPKYPAEVTQITDEKMRIVFQATWLAAQENGKWALEAYQQVVPIAEDYPPARILRDALVRGERIN